MQNTKKQLLICSFLSMALVAKGSVGLPYYPFFGHSILPAYAPAFPAIPGAIPAVSPVFPAAFPAPIPAAYPLTPKAVRFAPPSVPPHAYSVNIVTRALTPPGPFLLPPLGAQPLPGFNAWRR